MNNVAIIPARGGSKGLPNKNILSMNGKPLISYSINHCLQSEYFRNVFVSTDCPKICEIAKEFGAKVILRPDELSNDTASSESALKHAYDHIKNLIDDTIDFVAFLQCTSPIRKNDDLDKALELLLEENSDSLLSTVENHGFIWSKNDQGILCSINYDYRYRQRRQDCPKQFRENGSFYIFKPWVLDELNNRLGGKISCYEMQPESALEIDSKLDFDLIESLMRRKDV